MDKLSPGTYVGPYRVVRHIEEGRQADVYDFGGALGLIQSRPFTRSTAPTFPGTHGGGIVIQ